MLGRRPLFRLLVLAALTASTMCTGNMLMAQSLESFLSSLVKFGSMSVTQKDDILRISDQFHPGYNASTIDLRLPQQDIFPSDESKEALRTYLYKEIDTDYLEYETAEAIASMLSLGGLFPRDSIIAGIVGSSLVNGPAESSYTGEGNIDRLGRSHIFGLGERSTGLYNGIWGYAVGELISY